ncbi:MAG: hypothetical protein FD180_4452 [Planctomycetota bacterium]|nr:MAG: hypothetical protein FD180_4452 [Planctomycetota bacterium]
MRRFLLLACVISGCSGPPTLEERALEPLHARGDAFRDARGLQGADREAFFWLLWRAARRHTVNGQESSTVDVEEVTPEFLERRVAQGREAQEYPWAPRDEGVWRSSVLMYRVGTEALTNWHALWRQDEVVRQRVGEFAAGWAADKDGVLKRLLHYLNAEVLGARAKKKPRGLPDLDPETCLKEGGGRGTDLAIAAITLFRSWGVPAVLVRCPLVGGEAGGDAWVGIPGTDIWMKPADTEPASPSYFAYRRGDRRLPKVFVCEERNEFTHLVSARNALPFKTQYDFVWQPAADASAQLPGAVPVTIENLPAPAFLCMFAGGGLLAVAPGRPREDDATDFGPCAPGLLYVPATPGPRGLQLPLGPPFVLMSDGSREELPGEGAEVEWAWAASPEAPDSKPYVWLEGRFVPAHFVERDGKRLVAGPRNALWLVWREGPENGGLGKPVGRPFVVAEGGVVKEY